MSGGDSKTLFVYGSHTEEATDAKIKKAVGGFKKRDLIATKSLEESLTKSGKGEFAVEYAHKNDLDEHKAESMPSTSTQLRPLYIIWDWQKCPIPYYYKPEDLYPHIVDFLKEKGFFVTGFMGFGDVKTLNDSKYEYLKEHVKDNIELIHVPPSTDKAAKVALLQDVCDKRDPCPILLLTGNQGFIKSISSVRKNGFEVYLGYNKEAVSSLRESATEAWDYYSVFGVDEKLIASRKRTRKNKNSQARLEKRAKKVQAYKKKGEGEGEGSGSQD